MVSSEWRKDRTTGPRDNGPQDKGKGETGTRRNGEFTLYASRIMEVFLPCAEFVGL